MPKEKKRKLNPEEREVHDALFGPESDSAFSASSIPSHQKASSNPPPPLDPDIIVNELNKSPNAHKAKQAPQAKNQDPGSKFSLANMEKIYNEMLSFMSNAQKPKNPRFKGNTRKYNDYSDSESSEEDYYDEDESQDEDLPMSGPKCSIPFGLNVNEPQLGAGSSTVPGTDAPAQSFVPGAAQSSSLQFNKDAPGPCASSAAPVAPPLPDASLPLATDRPPKNWEPDPSVLAWASKSLDSCEWTKEDRKVFAEKFSPDPSHDHLFSAVRNPPDLLAAIRSPDLLTRDFLFKRAEAEQFLFSANEDLASGLRPLIHVLSDLKGKDMEETRVNLAYVFQSMASAICHLSRGRRELGRRFVPSDSASILFSNKPSHYCIFGYNSIDMAMEKTVEAKKINKDLVHVPKKRKFFRLPHYPQNFKSGKQWDNRDRYRNSNRGKFHKRGKHNRGSRGKGRGKNSKPNNKSQE